MVRFFKFLKSCGPYDHLYEVLYIIVFLARLYFQSRMTCMVKYVINKIIILYDIVSTRVIGH